MNYLNFKKFEQVLFFLVLIFPCVLVLRNFTINFVLILMSGISIYYFLKKKNYLFFKDFLLIYSLFFFLIIFINSIFKTQDFETLIKSFFNLKYVFLTLQFFLLYQKFQIKVSNFLFI